MSFIKILESIVGKGTIVQTHASEVLIQDEFVYKVKKPVYFGFLDFRTLKQRRAYCILEKELNSRFSKGIYLQVLKLIKTGEGYRLDDVSSSLPAVEYVVKMKRVPKGAFMDKHIEQRLMDDEKMYAVGYDTALLFKKLPVSAELVEDMDAFQIVAFNCRENFTQMNETAPEFVDWRFKFVRDVTEKFLIEHENLFRKRYSEGYVKDGHGDLRAEHLFFTDGRLEIIDCIDFNERFRTNDIVSEAVFLAMEFDYMGMLSFADAFMEGFLSVFNDDDSRFLLNFYKCYRAVVRAKVAMFSIQAMTKASPEYIDKMAEFHRLADMAVTYALTLLGRPLVFCGMIGTGKSVSAYNFEKRFPVRNIGTDEVRKRMAGLEVKESAVAPVYEGLYTPEKSKAVYCELGRLARKALAEGRLPLLDGTFLKKEYRELFEAELGAKPYYILFTASDEVILKRLEARAGVASATDGRSQHFEALKAYAAELPEPDYIVDTMTRSDIEEIMRNLVADA